MPRLSRSIPTLCFAFTVGANALAAQRTRLCADVTAERPASMCFMGIAESLDVRLDTLVSELKRSLPSSEFARLQRVQDLWRASRDSTCSWERDLFFGGTIASRVEAKCEIALTANRIGVLKVFLCPGAPVMSECAESRRYDTLPEP